MRKQNAEILDISNSVAIKVGDVLRLLVDKLDGVGQDFIDLGGRVRSAAAILADPLGQRPLPRARAHKP